MELGVRKMRWHYAVKFNTLNAEVNSICHLLALLGSHPTLHVSRIRVNPVTAQAQMSVCVCVQREFHFK
jgi:hypothetical protein